MSAEPLFNPMPLPIPDRPDAGIAGDEPRPVLRLAAGELKQSPDELAHEEPLEIRVRGRGISITMRTPGHEDELAAGFLFSEGIVQHAQDIVRIEPCERHELGNIVNVVLRPTVQVDFGQLTRHVFAGSSCGVCGRATIEAIRSRRPGVESEVTIDAATLLRLPDAMRLSQETFDRTGGLHAAALFGCDGRLIVVREDVGRHNAVDKVIGHALLGGLLPLHRHVLLVSGRSSFEIMQKSLAAQVPVVAAVSAPSSLAVEFAHSSGQTLVGFLREGRMNVYSNPQRIRFS